MVIRVRPSTGGAWQSFYPCACTYALNDVSSSEAGRTQDALMHKERVAQKRKINLSFWGLTPQETSTLLKAFNPEYIEMEYEDAMEGTTKTGVFYRGDVSAPVWRWSANNKIYEKIDFNLIER
ncbi:MAG: hypothetical protein HUK23_02135 [Sphaerochaetaceae bacterium]|nr:hypothetical protein [Sphaerochaetaceae bacterium]